MRYLPEPDHRHGTQPTIGVLLINLGTPEAATAGALRPYLREFLSDPRVVELPRLLWWPILNGVILSLRPRQSAQKYAKIWTAAGSPLKLHTQRQAERLRAALGERIGDSFAVEWAMRYGDPPVRQALLSLREQGCDRVLAIPLYPQYAASSTGSAFDAVCAVATRLRNAPALRLVKHFHDHPGYIGALAQSVREHWSAQGRPDRLVMSFHGVPRFTLDRGDPYHCECRKTGRLLAEALDLRAEQYLIAFQSRFGRARWLEPYTIDTMQALGKAGLRRVDVICPGFVADCLETLEEIAIENKAAFLAAGGGEFRYIPCLNEREDWIRALADLTMSNLEGWVGAPASQAALEASRERALELGARS
ncbi:MAG TPA: ferrochelatase [Burkholderiales bacterium]|nr:ferrochelatase [Burkholderiales bacterium]